MKQSLTAAIKMRQSSIPVQPRSSTDTIAELLGLMNDGAEQSLTSRMDGPLMAVNGDITFKLDPKLELHLPQPPHPKHLTLR